MQNCEENLKEITIDEFLKDKEFGENESYDGFIAYIQRRGMLNEKTSLPDKVFFTMSNLKTLYSEYKNLIKRTSKLLKMTYKELGELTGYTEGAFKAAITKGEISKPMKKAMILLLEIDRLHNLVLNKNAKIENLKVALIDIINETRQLKIENEPIL